MRLILCSNPNEKCRITVQRKHMYEDTLHKFRSGLDLSKHHKVVFIGHGDLTINDGGLKGVSEVVNGFCYDII